MGENQHISEDHMEHKTTADVVGPTDRAERTALAGEACASEIEITPEMIAAGVEAAELITYDWGSTPEGTLVSRVYRAMYKCAPDRP